MHCGHLELFNSCQFNYKPEGRSDLNGSGDPICLSTGELEPQAEQELRDLSWLSLPALPGSACCSLLVLRVIPESRNARLLVPSTQASSFIQYSAERAIPTPEALGS